MSVALNNKGRVEDFVIAAEAGESLLIRDAAYIAADGKAYKCDADDIQKIGFKGFVQVAVSIGNTAYIKRDLFQPGFSGLTAGSDYYLSGTAGEITATKPTNFKKVGRAVSASVIELAKDLTKRTRTYDTANTIIGGTTTRFDITNPGGSTFRYTFDGTGTDPLLSLVNNPIGSVIVFRAQNFNTLNNGMFVVTGAGANYVEVTNASGVPENDKTIGTGSVGKGSQIWTRFPALVYAEVEVVGAGSQGGGENDSDSTSFASSGGTAGAYAMKRFDLADLPATVAISADAVDGVAFSAFGSLIVAQSGGLGTAGGVIATGGDINLVGERGKNPSNSGGQGGSTRLGEGGYPSPGADQNGYDGTGLGSGGGGGGLSSTPTGQGGHGAKGGVLVHEYY